MNKVKESNSNNLIYSSYLIIILLPILAAYYYYIQALSINGFLSFPLDDPWIHLQFAKNLIDYHSFSYFKDQIVTAGSTSPLYVFILVIGFIFTNNEMILSYITGTVFFAAAAFVFYNLAIKEQNNNIIYGFLITLVFIFDPRMNFITLSGMETTMFIFLLLLGVYFYKIRNSTFLGITLGLIFWARPDGIAFIAAIIADYVYQRWIVKNKENNPVFNTRDVIKIAGIFFLFLLSYFAMNLYLSGTLLSNTYSAKVAYYIDSDVRITFLKVYIWQFFSEAHFAFMLPGFIIIFVNSMYDLFKRNYNSYSIYIFFILIFILIYFIKIPLFSRFGRYFMPMIPFYIMISMGGYVFLIDLFKDLLKNMMLRKIINSGILLFFVVMTLINFKSNSEYYAYHSKYIYDRHVKTAHWLKDNTYENDIIATHDIGAIGFYSGRKVIDIVGLINPDLTKESYRDDYNEVLTDFFNKNGVTFTAFYREWFLTLNQNPVFYSPDDQALEAIYVNNFYKNKTKILPRKINYLLNDSRKDIYDKNGINMIADMNAIIKTEPDFALAYFYKAYGYLYNRDTANYEINIEKAIELFPDFKDALLESANISIKKGDYDDARKKIGRVLILEPGNESARTLLGKINSQSFEK
ncbi:MAG TPA: hypothetical protein PKC58_07815 [Ignavibacteria bacterium]|mgnify:CR=1 FL=1|nr:hypothetical protein [Ignavibacteria bacterium]